MGRPLARAVNLGGVYNLLALSGVYFEHVATGVDHNTVSSGEEMPPLDGPEGLKKKGQEPTRFLLQVTKRSRGQPKRSRNQSAMLAFVHRRMIFRSSV